MPDEYKLFLKEKGIAYTETERIEEGIKEADIVYMTRVQRERFSDPMEYERVKHVYILKNSMLEGTKENMRILHPLPRVGEIAEDVDSNPESILFPADRKRRLHAHGNHQLPVGGNQVNHFCYV